MGRSAIQRVLGPDVGYFGLVVTHFLLAAIPRCTLDSPNGGGR